MVPRNPQRKEKEMKFDITTVLMVLVALVAFELVLKDLIADLLATGTA